MDIKGEERKMGIFTKSEQLLADKKYTDLVLAWRQALRLAEAGKEVIQNGPQSKSVERCFCQTLRY